MGKASIAQYCCSSLPIRPHSFSRARTRTSSIETQLSGIAQANLFLQLFEQRIDSVFRLLTIEQTATIDSFEFGHAMTQLRGLLLQHHKLLLDLVGLFFTRT